MTSPLSRRRALTGAATVGLGLPLLAACGDDGSGAATDTTDSTPSSPESSAPASSPTAPTDGATTTSEAPADGLVATSEVEVGGGVVLGDDEIVVVQPTEGEFKAFTAVCTHQGCLVGSVTDGVIVCPCHGSSYSAEDGSVITGPAPSALDEIAVEVVGDQVVRS